jgi:hypothetical protein
MLLAIALMNAITISHAADNWTGGGGKGMSITISVPQANGLAENQKHLPALVQAEFVSNFSGYSAISVLDWERLDDIYEKLYSDHYGDKAEVARQDLGNLAPTTYFMDGKITKTATGYHLQISISKTADKMTAASYSGTFTFWELDNLTGIRRASLELLQKMGVTLTAKAQGELSGAAAANHISAQTAFARGITAQRQGTEVAALSYYFQAATFDPSLREAASRSSVLNANISSGNMGNDVRNDIQWRKDWVARLKETEQFFDNFNKIEHMPYTLFYSKEIEQGKINYQNETVAISIETYLYGSGVWTLSIERALQAVYDGLNATGRKDIWELGSWPHRGVTDLNAFERRRNDFSVVFELVNNQNKVIGRQTLQAGGSWGLNWGNRPTVELSSGDRKTLSFQNVNANDITNNLTIRVASVNGKNAETAAIDGVLQIKAIAKGEVELNDKFRFSRGELQGFVGYGVKATELVIPSTIWGDQVISIGQEAFMNIGLISVTIPNSVRTIGNNAFVNDSLTSITIGENVNMGVNVFGTIYYYKREGIKEDVFQALYRQNGKIAGIYNISGYDVYFKGQENETAKIIVDQRKAEAKIIADQKIAEGEKVEEQSVRLGVRGTVGIGLIFDGQNSEWFDNIYGKYDEMSKADIDRDLQFAIGLTLNIWPSDIMALAAELNYNFFNSSYCYDGGCDKSDSSDYFMHVSISSHTISVPVLLRLGGKKGFYFEAGYQFGIPFYSTATVKSGKKFHYDNNIKDERVFLDFRTEMDQALVFGLGSRFHGMSGSHYSNNSLGVRFIYHLTKLDKDGTMNAPFLIGVTFAYDFQ